MPRHPFLDFRDFSGTSGLDIRPALLRELTDLYIQKPSHTAEEAHLFTELALRLIDHVDAAERAWLGARLAAYPGAPLAVIQRLAKPDGAFPHAVQEWSSSTNAQSLPRIEVPPYEETLSDTFFNALPAERRLILLHLDYAPVAPAPLQTTPEIVTRLEQAAMTRQADELAAALVRTLSVSPICAQRIAHDSTGEAVVAALKALAVPAPAFQRILLFLNHVIGQSSNTYFSLVQLYDEIREEAARRLVAIWRRDDPPASRKRAHRPELFDDRISHARDFARHDERLAAGTPGESRHKERSEN